MKLCDYKGCQIYAPDSGGKAGKGLNKTGSVQVRSHNLILAQFRFRVQDPDGPMKASKKAREWVDDFTLGEGRFPNV